MKFSGSLNVDKRQTAQKVRSGLQFLVEELLEFETSIAESDKSLGKITDWDSVKSIEDYIKTTTGIDPEHIIPAPQDLSVIPHSHIWWFHTEEED